MKKLIHRAFAAGLLAMALAQGHAQTSPTPPGAPASRASTTSERHLAPGFTARPAGAKIVLVPADIELFSISGGGVQEPRADWSAAAQKFFAEGLKSKGALLGPRVPDLTEKDMDEFGQLNALHGAVAEAVFVHHMMGMPPLPTKDKKLDWTLGEDAVKALREKTGADYALFLWIRDSYASNERKAAMIAMAIIFGAYVPGGQQVGYASLVDLKDGRLVWFNNLARMSGDLREAKPAQETVDLLLTGFPAAR